VREHGFVKLHGVGASGDHSRAVAQRELDIAADRYAEAGPARRALQAELEDVAEPMFDALRALARAGEDATTNPESVRAWRLWSEQLRATFETADRVWLALDASLDSPLIGP
jgi:hypothetical protein